MTRPPVQFLFPRLSQVLAINRRTRLGEVILADRPGNFAVVDERGIMRWWYWGKDQYKGDGAIPWRTAT